MNKYLKKFGILGLSLTVMACSGAGTSLRPSMYEGSSMTYRNITVNEDRYMDKKPVSDIDYNYLMALSDDYDHHGNSPVYLAVSYDPDSSKSKSSATTHSAILKGQMAKLGMRNAVVKTIPVNGSMDNEAVIAYDRLTARGPDNCGDVPGLTVETGSYSRYGMGCTMKNAMAKQIAYPGDLLGKSDMDNWDADRIGVAVNRDVRSGEISPFVPSYVLSELAGNTN